MTLIKVHRSLEIQSTNCNAETHKVDIQHWVVISIYVHGALLRRQTDGAVLQSKSRAGTSERKQQQWIRRTVRRSSRTNEESLKHDGWILSKAGGLINAKTLFALIWGNVCDRVRQGDEYRKHFSSNISHHYHDTFHMSAGHLHPLRNVLMFLLPAIISWVIDAMATRPLFTSWT